MNIFPPLSGQVQAYDLLVIGHLRWNRYFGEGPEAPPRGDPSTCTSTLIRGLDRKGQSYCLIVDPTLRVKPEDYYFDLNRRTGLKPSHITHCFITHEHYDHQAGVLNFPEAAWLAAPAVAALLKDSPHIDGSRVEGVSGEFLPGVYALPLPGHTPGLHGAAFVFEGRRFVAAGDGVMTGHHFQRETTEFEQDAALAAQTIRNLKESADAVIPGHDNLILVNRKEGRL